jgi:hypothetical protein
LAQYYVLPLTTVHLERNSLTAKVTIPLTRTGTENRLYLLQPFPHYISGRARLWRRPAGHVAVNTQRQYWIALPPQFDPMTECWGKEPVICPQSYPEMDFQADNCIDDLFHQATPRDPTCAPADQQDRRLPKAVRWKDTYWAIALHQPTEMKTACGKGTTMPRRKRMNVSGSIILHLPEHCTAVLSGMQLKATNRWSEQVQGEVMGLDASQWDPKLFTFLTTSNSDNSTIPDFDVDAELQALGSEDTAIEHVRTTLRRYLNETERLINSPNTYASHTHHAVLSLWAVVVVAALAILTWKCRPTVCRRRTSRRHEPDDEEEEEVPLPPRRPQRQLRMAHVNEGRPGHETSVPILE